MIVELKIFLNICENTGICVHVCTCAHVCVNVLLCMYGILILTVLDAVNRLHMEMLYVKLL